jgi:hypothetical protein
MAFGFQVFNPQGQVIVDITDRLTRIVGAVGTGTSPGSIQVAEWNGQYGTPWLFVQQRNQSANQFGKRAVSATISGTTLSWTFEPSAFPQWEAIPAIIQFGVY